MKILWLASWYPNPYEPFNGDFIQRHAQAVAELIPLDVMHVLQAGHTLCVEKELTITYKTGNLTEYIHAFTFKPAGNVVADTIRYNVLYHRYYRKIIRQYIALKGMPDLVHVHVPVKAGLIAIRILNKFHIPFIVSEQSSHYEPASPDYFLRRSRYFRKNTQRIFETAKAVTNVSATIGARLQQLFSIQQYTTIHNLVDTDVFYYKPRIQQNKIRLIHVSALGEQKNPTGIIDALAVLKTLRNNWECVICGPYTKELQVLVKEKELETFIHFTGALTYKEVAAEMQQSDVFILFSNHENFPCVVVEALCCGLAVITSDAGGTAEAINENNGVVVQPGNVQQLVAAMQLVIKNSHHYNNPEIADQAAALYSKPVIAGQFMALYRKMLSITPQRL